MRARSRPRELQLTSKAAVSSVCQEHSVSDRRGAAAPSLLFLRDLDCRRAALRGRRAISKRASIQTRPGSSAVSMRGCSVIERRSPAAGQSSLKRMRFSGWSRSSRGRRELGGYDRRGSELVLRPLKILRRNATLCPPQSPDSVFGNKLRIRDYLNAQSGASPNGSEC